MSFGENLWLYFLLLFGIIAVPGMDMMFVLANALAGGRPRGLAATLGVGLGGAVHSLNGALAIGILAGLLPVLYLPLLLAGAAYMIWIGIALVHHPVTAAAEGPGASRSNWRAFRQGAVTCLVNPKAYLFMLAVYPQFLKPVYGAVWAQGLVLGVVNVATQLAVYGGVALAAGQARAFLFSRPRALAGVSRTAGGLLIAAALLGLWQAFAAGHAP
ncbi:MAG TPA: LysE family translocator [Mesorhizobium sp.]|jgi:threonine/homoserine/homoserine lactone efflux protein|nr:LysE family translocator [Mesorhizobium sp.]